MGDFGGVSSELLAAIAGAIVGSVSGGAISFVLQRAAIRQARDQRNAEQLQIRQALGNTLLFKLIRIHGNLYSTQTYIKEAFERADKAPPGAQPWQYFRPLANFPENVHFSPEEMGLLLSLKDNDLFNKAVDLDVAHNSLIEATKVMCEEHRALTSKLIPDEIKGDTLSISIDEQARRVLVPQMLTVNGLMTAIKENSRSETILAEDTVEKYQALLKDKLGVTYKFERNSPPKEAGSI